MLSFFGDRKTSKARKQAKEWIQLADRIDHFRSDVLNPATLAELRTHRDALKAELKNKSASVSSLATQVDALEPVLRQTGGSLYPRNSGAEFVDMIVVGAILVIGIRTFFLQPFKIPTNSMYPTYNGLTTEVYFGDEQPGLLHRWFRVGQLGAGHRAVEGAPGDELILPLVTGATLQQRGVTGRGVVKDPGNVLEGFYLSELPTRNASGMRFLVLPGPAAFYEMIVGEEVQTIKVSADFSMNHVLQAILDEAGGNARIERNRYGYPAVLRTGIEVPADGGAALSFDIKSGDMLFVDRFTYHFRAPRVGDPFVFNTTQIRGMDPGERGKYYIKRIGGSPGQTLQVQDGALLIDGEPATQSEAFVRNNEQRGEYEGYGVGIIPTRAGDRLTPYHLERPREMPPESYFALGDNSDESSDSRYWGFVPESAIIGKAIFIYYPFSHRWGVAE